MIKIDIAARLNAAGNPAGSEACTRPTVIWFALADAGADFQSKTAAGCVSVFIDKEKHALAGCEGDANHLLGTTGRRAVGGAKAVRNNGGCSACGTRTGNIKNQIVVRLVVIDFEVVGIRTWRRKGEHHVTAGRG